MFSALQIRMTSLRILNDFPQISTSRYSQSGFDLWSIRLQWPGNYLLHNTAFHWFLILKRMFPLRGIVLQITDALNSLTYPLSTYLFLPFQPTFQHIFQHLAPVFCYQRTFSDHGTSSACMANRLEISGN